MLTRRQLVMGAGAAVGLGAAGVAALAPWRRRSIAVNGCASLNGQQIRWIVPNAPGGGYDAESRLFAPFLAQRLGAAIVIENQSGAGGIAGARALANARPDGRTMGMLGAPGLLVAALTGTTAAPDPARDFTIFGRLGRSFHVWATGAHSQLTSIDQAVDQSRTRPLVFALNEVGSASFVTIAGAAHLVGADIQMVPGFSGNRAACLAAVRGDVDLVCYNYETIADMLVAGDLRALLQVSAAPIADDAVLNGVPVLGGPSGYLARQASANADAGRDALRTADSLVRLIGSGRLIVGPPALPADLAACLSDAVYQTMTDAAFTRVAKTTLDVARGPDAARDLGDAGNDAALLLPIVRDALKALDRS